LGILHLSYDLGDLKSTDTTTAVINLINVTREISPVTIVSLNRTVSKRDELVKQINENTIQVKSFGFPYGIMHLQQLRSAYGKIRKAEGDGLIQLSSVNLIHSHKVSFEGYIGYRLALEKELPLFLTLRQTDFVVLKVRPDLRAHYKKILEYSSRIFYLIPVMPELLKDIVGEKYFYNKLEKKLVYLPNIIENNRSAEPKEITKDSPLITVLRITKRSVRRKNLKNLIKAVSLLDNIDFKLHIIGGGDYLSKVKDWVNSHKLENKVFFTGPISNDQIDKHYSGAKAFILPSFSESFGLVYAESLRNGTPILYSKGVLGFDGVFEDVGCGVDPYSVESIKNGIIDIIKNNDYYRKRIKILRENDAFEIFSPAHALKTYKKSYFEVMKSKELQTIVSE
jgi:glycosyltransferase involved in cell wall biosynthesis